jgi:hypothetical protein
MRLSRLDQDSGFLAARGDSSGSFLRWMELLEAGLPSDIPIRDMISYGWILPTFRIAIPDRYFTSRTDYPYRGGEPREIEDDDVWADLLWHSAGTADGFLYRHFPQQGEWFIHPLEREGTPLADKLREATQGVSLPSAETRNHSNGSKYYPWIDYFPYWKGYELIEVLDQAKLVGGVWCTTHSESALRGLLEKHYELRRNCMAWVHRKQREWSGRARTFTHLARYRMMRAALWAATNGPPRRDAVEAWTLENAVRSLTARLAVNCTDLEDAWLPDLLSLAKDWKWWMERDGRGPGRHAWGQLQLDILFAIEWLHILTGKTIEHYYDVWANRGRQPRNVLALEEALPQEFRSAEQYFLNHFVAIRGAYDHLPAAVRLTNPEIADVLKRLRRKTPIVTDWLINYQRMHEALAGPPAWDYADVTPNTIMHDFTLLALFAEKMLEALSSGVKESVKELVRSFCEALEAKDQRFVGAWQIAAHHWKDRTQLKSKPCDPFGDIERLRLAGSPEAVGLARALLFFGLTRNYFGHHTYLDSKLLGPPDGGAAVRGVVTATLYLTAVPCGVR